MTRQASSGSLFVTLSALAVLVAFAWVGATPAVAEGRGSMAGGITIIDDAALLGVSVEGTPRGARVVEVSAGSAAREAGIRRGDRIIAVDGVEIDDHGTLAEEIRSRSAGDRMSITIRRDDDEQTLDVTLGRREGKTIEIDGDYTLVSPNFRGGIRGRIQLDDQELDDFMENTYACEGDDCRFTFDERRWYKLDCIGGGCPAFAVQFYKRPMLGVEVVSTTPELRRHLGGTDDAGVLIGKVIAGSPAELGGIEVGDLVVAVNGQSPNDRGEIKRQLEESAGGSMRIDVIRDGRSTSLIVDIPEIQSGD